MCLWQKMASSHVPMFHYYPGLTHISKTFLSHIPKTFLSHILFITFLPQKQPFLGLPFKSILSNLKSVLGRPLHCLWAAIWIPCTLPLPIFVPIVLWSLLTLLKCEIINFGDLRQKALSCWKFRIFYSAAFLRILRRNNFNCQITPRVNPD